VSVTAHLEDQIIGQSKEPDKEVVGEGVCKPLPGNKEEEPG